MNPIYHVAIIMDGNGRWGLKKKKSRNLGHKAGLNTVENIIKHTIKNKIKFLTLYAFSTENWKRPDNEINFLFDLIRKHIKKNLKKIIKQGIKINIIGKQKKLPPDIVQSLKLIEKKTKKNNAITINLALNYGSKEEIVDACRKFVQIKHPSLMFLNFLDGYAENGFGRNIFSIVRMILLDLIICENAAFFAMITPFVYLFLGDIQSR